jgi:hypothetical protein
MRATFPAHLILLDLVTLIMFVASINNEVPYRAVYFEGHITEKYAGRGKCRVLKFKGGDTYNNYPVSTF